MTPKIKNRIAELDALAYLNRLVNRNLTTLKPDRVAYCVWCNDAGHLIDDGTVFRLGDSEYRLCTNIARIGAGLLCPHVDFVSAEQTIRHGRDRTALELGVGWLVSFDKRHLTGGARWQESISKARGGGWWDLTSLVTRQPTTHCCIHLPTGNTRSDA